MRWPIETKDKQCKPMPRFRSNIASPFVTQAHETPSWRSLSDIHNAITFHASKPDGSGNLFCIWDSVDLPAQWQREVVLLYRCRACECEGSLLLCGMHIVHTQSVQRLTILGSIRWQFRHRLRSRRPQRKSRPEGLKRTPGRFCLHGPIPWRI